MIKINENSLYEGGLVHGSLCNGLLAKLFTGELNKKLLHSVTLDKTCRVMKDPYYSEMRRS